MCLHDRYALFFTKQAECQPERPLFTMRWMSIIGSQAKQQASDAILHKKIQKDFVKYKLKPVFVIATFTACSFCESLCHNLLSFEINFNRFKSLTSATWGPRILLGYITIVLKISTRIKINEHWQQAHSAIQSSSNTQPVCNIKLLSKFLQQSP